MKRFVCVLPDDTPEAEPAGKRLRLLEPPWPDSLHTVADHREGAHATSYTGTFEEVDVFWQKVSDVAYEKWSLQKHSDGWAWWWSESRGVWWQP